MDARPPRYQPYRDVPAAPFRWRLGLRPLDPADWIEIDEHYEHDLEVKHRVLADHHTTAFCVLPDVVAEGREVFDALVDHLRTGSDRWPAEAAAVDAAVDAAVALVDAGGHPLDAAGRMVQEDLVVLVAREGELVCGGGSVCFPNRWDLRSKVGRSMAAIHAPVARLNDQLAGPIDQALDRLTPAKSFWRLGWGVLDTAELYQAVDGTAPPRPVDAPPESHVLRVERETLRRFPVTGCVLFTIRTHLTPLGAVPADAGTAELAAAIDALPADVAEYKQLDTVGAELVEWLRSRGQRATAGEQ